MTELDMDKISKLEKIAAGLLITGAGFISGGAAGHNKTMFYIGVGLSIGFLTCASVASAANYYRLREENKQKNYHPR